MTNKTQDVVVHFSNGKSASAAMNEINGDIYLFFYMPHLNPGMEIAVSEETEGRVSCTMIRRTKVKRVFGNLQSGKLLTARILLTTPTSDLSPLPVNNKRLSLIPEFSTSAIVATVGESPDEDKGNSFYAHIEIAHVYQGAELTVENKNTETFAAKITDAQFVMTPAYTDTTVCMITVKRADPAKPDVQNANGNQSAGTSAEAERQLLLPVVEPKASEAENKGGRMQETQKLEHYDQDVPKPAMHSRAPAYAAVTMIGILSLVAAYLIINIIEPSPGSNNNQPAGAASANKAVLGATSKAVAASASAKPSTSKTATAVNIMHLPIPMNEANLRFFFQQGDARNLFGRVSGRAPNGELGIQCTNQPRYDETKKTTDVSGCKIALPAGAKPGTYPLDEKASRAWFHEADPACFTEPVAPYQVDPLILAQSLRINLESCAWTYDPVRKCFDYTKCTYTVPEFVSE